MNQSEIRRFRAAVRSTASEQPVEAILSRLRELRAITGPTATFNVPPNSPGSFSPDWGRPGCCPNWAMQYTEDTERAREARAFLEELTGLPWPEAEALCRERDTLHDLLGALPSPLTVYAAELLAPIIHPTGGEQQAQGYFRTLLRNHLIDTYEAPTREELDALVAATRERFSFLSPNRIAAARLSEER